MPPPESLLFLNFNQDQGCFACGTDNGFRIYNVEPFKETFRRRFDLDEVNRDEGAANSENTVVQGTGIGIVEMLFRCNILALVGGGHTPRFSPNKVMLWDDHQSRPIGELSFRVEVRAVKLRRDKIVVVLEHKIYVYNFSDLKILRQLDTCANPAGLCALSPTQGSTVMACPGLNKGQVRVELFDLGSTKFVSAHDGELAHLALSLDGTRLATASDKGTLIRVFDPSTATLLHEFRRGADRATIYSIAFSPTLQYIACSSDKGTVHVWVMPEPCGGEDGETSRHGEIASEAASSARARERESSESTSGRAPVRSGSSERVGEDTTNTNGAGPLLATAHGAFSFAKGFLPTYFSGERSLAQFRLPDFTKSCVAFGPSPETLIVVTAEGTYYKVSFDKNGGGCEQREFNRFMKSELEEEEGGWGAAAGGDRM